MKSWPPTPTPPPTPQLRRPPLPPCSSPPYPQGKHNDEIQSLFDVQHVLSNRADVKFKQAVVLDGKPNHNNGDGAKVAWGTNERFGGHVSFKAVDTQILKQMGKCPSDTSQGCVFELEHGWRITLRRAEVWATERLIGEREASHRKLGCYRHRQR